MMTLEQFGLYNWLLDYSWNNEGKPCHLEYDPEKLARLVGLQLKSFLKIWLPIQRKFKLWVDPETKVEYIYNPRLLEVYQEQAAFIEKQRQKGIQSGAARRTKTEPELNRGSIMVRTGIEPEHEPGGQPGGNPLKSNTKEPPNPLSGAFESRWQKYPNRVGRKAAERHFRATVKTEIDLADLDKALANYCLCLQENPSRRPQNGSTWFNNWRDWIQPPLQPKAMSVHSFL